MEQELMAMMGGAMAAPQQTQGTTIRRDEPEPDQSRAALVTFWASTVRHARQFWTERAFKRMRDDMAFASGRQWPNSQDDHMVDEAHRRYIANITLRHIQSRTAAIYGKNPRVVARRKTRLLSTVWDGQMQSLQAAMLAAEQTQGMDQQSVAVVQDAMQTMAQNRQLATIAKTLELLFEHEIAEQALPFKTQMKTLVRRCLTTGVGYAKPGYQRAMAYPPDVTGQIDDCTRKLANLERLSADVADGEVDPYAREREEMRLALEALSKTDQIVVREGLTVSYPDSWSIIPDTGMKQLRGFVGCGWVAEEFFLPASKIKEIYKLDVKHAGATAYNEKAPGEFAATDTRPTDPHTGSDEPGQQKDFFCIWEIYNKDDGLVYTVLDGHKDFLLPPTEPDVKLERFWPWFTYLVNEVYDEERVFPPSDVELMRDMQLELNRARQGLREHRKANRPQYFTRSGAMDPDDKAKVAAGKANEVIELMGLQPGERVEDLIQPKPQAPIDPRLYDPSPAYEDYLRVLGQHEASLGGTSGATATETSIAEGARLSHVSSAVDDLDEFLTEFARAAGQILFLNVPPERVQEVVGPGAVWPDLSREQVAKEIFLDVEAASTGRPNQAQQVQVAQQVFPLLMQIPGLSPQWMAEELLRRLDDRIDLTDAFAANVPSIMTMNRAQQMAPPEATAQGNDPRAQGDQGGNNAPGTAPPQVNAAPRPDAGQAQMPQVGAF
jgi:hypothetical protein